MALRAGCCWGACEMIGDACGVRAVCSLLSAARST